MQDKNICSDENVVGAVVAIEANKETRQTRKMLGVGIGLFISSRKYDK